MMDSAIDTLSTTSEHSVASSSESTTAMQSSKRSSHSPSNYNSNHTGSTGGSISGSGGGSNGNNRSSSAIGIHHQHHLTPAIGQSSLNGNLNNIINIGGVNNNNINNNNNNHRRSISPTSSPPPLPPHSSSSLSLSQIPLSHRGGSSGGHPSSPPSSAAALSHQQMMQQIQHQLSPPHVSTPNSLGVQMGPRGISHLPPHSLGLLNSLQMMHHASPLELMAAAHHHAGVPPRSYNSPPPISTSDPSANECKLVEYRGQKVAAFIISGDTMLCLPQAFELFLKHLVGGLHTVYTKLKRLDIVPLVCNVEQVRILRGLGAIQPGVNRCKLLSCKDFDILYRDCTTARCLSIKPPESSRPGRPPKRGPVGLSLAPTHLSGHPQLKKHRLDNGDYAYENGHITDISRLDKSPLLGNGYNPPPINHMAFMQMNHHPGSALMSPGMPPHGLHRPDGQMMKAAAQAAAAAGGMSAAAGMDAIARSGIWENCRAAYEDIVKHLERNYRLREERTDDGRPPIIDQKPRDLSSRNGSPDRQSPVLNLSKSGIGPLGDDNVSNLGDASDRSDTGVQSPQPSVHGDNDNLSEDNITDDEAVRNDKEEDLSDTEERNLSQRPSSVTNVVTAVNVNTTEQAHLAHQRAINYSTLAAASAVVAASSSSSNAVCVTSPNNDSVVGHSDQQSTSSTETLLRNIQSLLKVAADNAKQQERQITYEKAELKMDVLREREVKDSLERQLVEERKLRVLYQKRYRRERKIRIRLQQQIEGKRKSLNPDDHQQFKGLSDSGKNCQDGIENKNNIKTEKLPQNERNHRRSSESPAAYNTRSSSSGGGGITEDRGNSGEQSSVRNIQTDRINERIGSSGIDREGSSNHLQTGSGGGSTTSSGPVTSQADGGGAVGASGIVGNGSNSNKGWNYPGIDLMASGAFWQNYSETLAQEIEMERKARQQNSDRDVKSPLQERQQAYYKNSVLFGSAT